MPRAPRARASATLKLAKYRARTDQKYQSIRLVFRLQCIKKIKLDEIRPEWALDLIFSYSFSDYGLSTYCRTSLVRFYNFHRNLFQVFQAPFHVYQDWSATFSALAKLQVKLSSIWFAYWHMYEAIKLSESARASDSFPVGTVNLIPTNEHPAQASR